MKNYITLFVAFLSVFSLTAGDSFASTKLAMSDSGYQKLTRSNIKNAIKEKKKLVLFFHATWCPTCNALESDIKENLSLIPSDVVIFRINYDRSTKLKKILNITSQSTMVLLRKKWKEYPRIMWVTKISDVISWLNLSENDMKSMKKMDTSQYDTYSHEKLASAISTGKKPVIFFHATWCPTCIWLEKDIKEKLSSIPTNVVILQADYDTSVSLKKTYNITSQSTLVLVGNDKKEIRRSIWLKSIDSALRELQLK